MHYPSLPRKRGSRATVRGPVLWIPAFAGMTHMRLTLRGTLGAVFSALRLDLPDFPRPWIGSVLGSPVAVKTVSLRQDARAHCVHERVQVDRHEVILVDKNALNVRGQRVALLGFEARLMLFPQCFDLWFADTGCAAATDGIDANIGRGSAWPRIDVLHNRADARKAFAALADLGAERRSFEHFELAANSNGAQIGEDA